ncbi:MAG: TIGR03067 domain-containing protein [Bacteroidia bacterium]|nr:TIGR03067 domain-containing protein [Bacteroidia bacterium]
MGSDTETDIEGKWKIILSVSAGKANASFEESYLMIKGNSFERHTPDYVFERTFTIDSIHKPHHINLLITNEPDKGKIFLGIYKIEGDSLFIAHSLPGFPRPVSFESTLGNKQIFSLSVKRKRLIKIKQV